MKNKPHLIDLHGIHLLDYEPYYLSQQDVEKSCLLSCPVLEVFSQVVKFKSEYQGRIGVLPYTYSGFDNAFFFENEQMRRLYSFLTLGGMADSIIPFFAISNHVENRRNIEKILNKSEIKPPFGFKFHSLAAQKPIGSLYGSRTMSLIDSIKGVVLFHTGKDEFSSPNQIYTLAKRYRSVSFIAAHFGSLDEEFLSKIKDYENVYIDTSILSDLIKRIGVNNSQFEEVISRTISKFGLENKLLFGSDYPWTKLVGTSPEKERFLLLNSNLPLQIKEKWMFKTAEHLFEKKGQPATSHNS